MKCLAIRSTILSNHHHFTNRQKWPISHWLPNILYTMLPPRPFSIISSRFLYVSGSNNHRIYCKNCNPVCPLPFSYESCNPYANICLGEILALRFCQSIFYPCREAIIAQPLVWCRSLFALNLKTESGCPYAPFTVANSIFRMLYHTNHGNPVGSINSASFYRSPIPVCQTSLSYDNRRLLKALLRTNL